MSSAKRRRTLYICYLSLEDPLVHTQVVAYLEGLAGEGHTVHLLTFEPTRPSRGRRHLHRAQLARKGIWWHGLRYHKRPSLPATAFDVLVGAAYAAVLAIRHRLDTIHARSHVPAAMALIVMRLLDRGGLALVFDIRGLMAEEYVDAGRWAPNSIPFRLTKRIERAAISRACGTVVLTHRVRAQLFGPRPPLNTLVIPCCVDTEHLVPRCSERDDTRAKIGVRSGVVMAYVGKFGGWYMLEEMADFFRVARRVIPSLHFLILTQSDLSKVRTALEARGVANHATIGRATPEELPAYLAAADFGICFIRPAPSKASSSPTKVGEYLAAGLPVLSTAGVGDLDSLITPDVGVLVEAHSATAHREAAESIRDLLETKSVRERAQTTAARELSLAGIGIPRYRQLYDNLDVRRGK